MNIGTDRAEEIRIVNALRELEKQLTLTHSDAIAQLHAQGFSIMDTIYLLVRRYGMRLGDAKDLVSGHPLWVDFAMEADKMHAELIEIIESEMK